MIIHTLIIIVLTLSLMLILLLHSTNKRLKQKNHALKNLIDTKESKIYTLQIKKKAQTKEIRNLRAHTKHLDNLVNKK